MNNAPHTLHTGDVFLSSHGEDTRYIIATIGYGHRADCCRIVVSVKMNDGSWHTTNNRAVFSMTHIFENLNNGRWIVA